MHIEDPNKTMEHMEVLRKTNPRIADAVEIYAFVLLVGLVLAGVVALVQAIL